MMPTGYDKYLKNLGYLNPLNNETYELKFSIGPTVPDIEKVIFNDPATVVLWSDHTKTIVKVKEGETFDRWTGLSMAICKKIYGNKFHSIFTKHCGRSEEEKDPIPEENNNKNIEWRYAKEKDEEVIIKFIRDIFGLR